MFFVVAGTLVTLHGKMAFSSIAIVGPTNHTATIVLADGDLVSLDPDPVTYVGAAPIAIVRNPLTGAFPPGAGWTFTFNPIATPTLNGTLTISHYQATSKGPHNGAGRLNFTYARAAADPPLANLRFIQAVNTNVPLGGKTKPLH